jgi:hypothetical protein
MANSVASAPERVRFFGYVDKVCSDVSSPAANKPRNRIDGYIASGEDLVCVVALSRTSYESASDVGTCPPKCVC